ncbi:hypothetical protein [Paenibacillus albus]|uniref:DUF2642 domain-containing protein n=1 Tax=Paenibacillus albus TaxID=2495582 RepID=A0A3S9AAF5_9BACL|nr:hypothetical protein [Paenibacillus albus]AZN42683.1 hypothetical protein EJC50_25565 [Paenibacillus albus]
MNELRSYINDKACIEVTGNRTVVGKLIDAGIDLLVMFDGQRYVYLPLSHVHSVKKTQKSEDDQYDVNAIPQVVQVEKITVAKVLKEATGLFVEIFVSGNKPDHGYLRSVKKDYLILHSPIYNTIYIALDHLKWLIPYPVNHVPFAKSDSKLMPTAITTATTFDELLNTEVGNLVCIDFGSPSERIGVISDVNNGIINFVDVEGSNTLILSRHIKTIYVPTK